MMRIATLVKACAAVCVAAAVGVAATQPERVGVLLLAHGGKPEWNERVHAIASAVDARQPTEVAFGMATRPNIQAAIDRLQARGVTRIVAVPLFVSSHSSVITSTEYLLGLRSEMPPDLKIFARMSHGTGGHGGHGDGDHGSASHHSPEDNTRPVIARVPISITPALNDHPLVAAILADRAKEISRDPSAEALILVAHGPVPEADNEKWLKDMGELAKSISGQVRFKSSDYLTVRDDAPKPIRDAATEALRELVSRRTAEGSRVLVVPLLLSYGGIEEGIRKRLEGLEYEMARHALIPDDRIVTWVNMMVKEATAP
jgi:sirohydrochlorin cobaltochelatase